MFKSLLAISLSSLLIAGGYSYSVYGQTNQRADAKSSVSVEQEHPHKHVADQEQAPQPEGDKHCERPNPKGDPNVGGTDPNKLGCGCKRTCENGRPTENYKEGSRCKVHCKPDNCDCPNPCKT